MMTPKLRFKEFKDEFVEKALGEIFTYFSTNSLSRDKLNLSSGTIKNYDYRNVS